MVHHEKYGQGTHEKVQQEKDKDKQPPAHQGPVGTPETMGGTGSPTSGPTGEPMVKPPELPGQPKEGEESAAGEVGETDIPAPEPPKK